MEKRPGPRRVGRFSQRLISGGRVHSLRNPDYTTGVKQGVENNLLVGESEKDGESVVNGGELFRTDLAEDAADSLLVDRT